MLKRENGFSLVELMAVCAIMAIIMAIAIPYYVSYKRSTCDRVAQEDLANIAAAWEKYIIDDSNLNHKPPQDLKDLAGKFYGWGGTSTKCDVRFYLDHSTLTVYAASYKGSHPRGPGSRYMYMMKMPAGLSPSSAKLEDEPSLFWSILGSIGSLFEPSPAYARNNNNQNQNQNQGGNQNQNQNQNQNGNNGNTDSNHQDRNTNGNQQGQGNANGNAWGQGNGNNGNGNDSSGNSGDSGQSGSGSSGDSSSDTSSNSGGSDAGTSDSNSGSSGGASAGTSGGSDTGTAASGGSDSGTAASGGGTSGDTDSSGSGATQVTDAAVSGTNPIGLVSTSDLDSAWKAYPFGVGPTVSSFDSSGNYVER